MVKDGVQLAFDCPCHTREEMGAKRFLYRHTYVLRKLSGAADYAVRLNSFREIPAIVCDDLRFQYFFVFKQGNRQVYSFEEASDYVYDVQWSPTHPAVFAAVDGQSRLCLWNLNEDTEVCCLWDALEVIVVLKLFDIGLAYSYKVGL